MNVERERGLEIAVDLREVSGERCARRQDGDHAAIDSAKAGAVEVVEKLCLHAAIDGLRGNFIRSGRFDVHFAIDRCCGRLAGNRSRLDAAVHSDELQRHRRRNAQLVVDAHIASPSEMDPAIAFRPDRERVAVESRREIALILSLRIGIDAARVDDRHHADLGGRIAVDRDGSVDFVDIEAGDRRRGPFVLESRCVVFERHAGSREADRQKRIDDSAVRVHRSAVGLTILPEQSFMDASQTTLLRVAAFLVDALTIAILLILPASVISYLLAWLGGAVRGIAIVWAVAVAVLVVGMLLRDGYHGRSIGKQMLGLRLLTPHGEGCGYGRSVLRNLPVIIPVWNLLEVVLVVSGRPRTGDRIARTRVTEE